LFLTFVFFYLAFLRATVHRTVLLYFSTLRFYVLQCIVQYFCVLSRDIVCHVIVENTTPRAHPPTGVCPPPQSIFVRAMEFCKGIFCAQAPDAPVVRSLVMASLFEINVIPIITRFFVKCVQFSNCENKTNDNTKKSNRRLTIYCACGQEKKQVEPAEAAEASESVEPSEASEIYPFDCTDPRLFPKQGTLRIVCCQNNEFCQQMVGRLQDAMDDKQFHSDFTLFQLFQLARIYATGDVVKLPWMHKDWVLLDIPKPHIHIVENLWQHHRSTFFYMLKTFHKWYDVVLQQKSLLSYFVARQTCAFAEASDISGGVKAVLMHGSGDPVI
jgi:hypothetical protein